LSLEQIIADWIRAAWLRDHPDQPFSDDAQWPVESARDLARVLRSKYHMKRHAGG
jgi:hypothetical protein